MSSKTKRPRQPQQQTKKPQEESEQDEEWTENDIIRCICGEDEEDGLMIQCSHCLSWIHCACIGINRNNIPEHYKCHYCKKKSKKEHAFSTYQEYLKNKKSKKSMHLHGSKASGDAEHKQQQRGSKKSFKAITKSIIDNTAVKERYRSIRKLWQQYQISKEKMTPSQKTCFASYPTMESSELLCPSISKVSARPLQRFMRTASFSSQQDPSIQKGIFADEHIQENRYIMEVMGKVIERTEYKMDERNLYSTLYTTLPHIFFHKTLDLCVDARYFGNDARFVRRACRPNSELKTILVQDDPDIVHLGIYTTTQVSRGEEITLPWHWARLSKMIEDFNEDRDTEWDEVTRSGIERMLATFKEKWGDCACDDKDNCLIEFLKDQIEKLTIKEYNKMFTDSTDEETPRSDKYHRPSVPPSPADSVENQPVILSHNALIEMKDKKLPMKKRWLQRYLRESSLQS